MTAHQTKFFKLKEVSFPILLWIVGVSVALVLHVFGVFSHAKPIENEDKVTVDGVENVVQYLTSLVLHAPWTSSQLITIQYDGGIDALRVNGRVNADALVIDAGQVNNNSSVEGNAVFWWMGNRVDGQTSNNLIVGWENNTINFARLNGAIPGRFWVSQGGGSVVIGSAKSEIRTSDNVLNIGTTNSSFSNKTRNVAAIGWQVVAQDVENSVAFWAGKKTLASNSILLGKSINAGGKNQIFVWSDSDEEFAPEHSNAFYVNAANGFGLNTTAPRTKLDLGNVGVLKIAKTEPKNCSQSSAGVTSYAGSVFCGCDGKEWIPLTSDMTPEKVAACKTLGKVKCIGTINTDSNATNMWESSAYSRWNHESDKREPMGWKYSSRDKLGACEYNCKIWFHPGANDPEGWLQVWACKACSEVVNKFRWKTAGTGNDNCDFTCKASFKYTNSSTQRTCSDCEVGTYTENDNQDKVCKNCNAPERLSTGGISPAFWTHYYTFDTKGTGKNACDFTCDARYAYFFNGKGKHDSRDSLSADLGSQALDLGISVGRGEGWKGGIGANPLPGQGTPLIKKDWVKMWTSFFPVSYNACVYCKVGTWSAGWKSKECTNCTNKQKNIDYWVDNVKGTLSDFSTYIGNGSANDCDWKCDANKGLEKHGDICKCRANTHLEWGTCIANTSNGQCNLRRQPSGNWVKIWATTYSRIWNPDLDNPNYKGTWSAPATKSWVYVENATSLSPCQWSCATGYEPSDNTCVKKAVPVKGACAQNVTVPIDGTKLVDYAQTNSSLFCSPGTLSNPRILDGKLEWDCKGLNGWASETCRVSCPANYTLQNGACVKSENFSCENVQIKVRKGCGWSWVGDEWSNSCRASIEKISLNGENINDKIKSISGKISGFIRQKDWPNQNHYQEEIVDEKFSVSIWEEFESSFDECYLPGCERQSDWSWDYVAHVLTKDGTEFECPASDQSYFCLNLPVNAVANNDKDPISSDKNYFYSTNKSEICSFQCKKEYTYKSGKCVKQDIAEEADVTVKLKWENPWQSYLSCMVRIKVEWKSSSYGPFQRRFEFKHNWGGEYIANLKEHYPNLKIKTWDVVKIQKVDCSGNKINNKWPQWESREDCKSTGQMRFYPCKIWHTINTSPYTIEVPLGDYRRS